MRKALFKRDPVPVVSLQRYSLHSARLQYPKYSAPPTSYASTGNPFPELQSPVTSSAWPLDDAVVQEVLVDHEWALGLRLPY